MPARTVTITGLGDFRQLQAELERTGVISAQSNKSIADSAARAGEAAAAQAKEMGASADEQEEAAARAAGAYVDGAARMTQAQKAAAAAAAASADASGKAADEIVAASARAVEAQRAIEKASLDTAASADAAGARLGTAFDEGTSKAGSALTRLGQTGASWGIPLSGSLTKMGKKFDEADSKAGKFSSVLASGGKLAITAGLVGFGVAAVEGVKGASSLQASMTRLETQAGASSKQVKTLTSSILGMAGEVGAKPQELAEGMYHVVSALNATTAPAQRVSTEYGVMKAAAEGAQIGGANIVNVTNALDAAVISGLPGLGSYTHAMGALNTIVGAGDMTMQNLADALGTGLLAPMKNFGVSLQDIGGALAVFGDNNLRGAAAATKLTSAIRVMAAPSKTAAGYLAEVGIGATELGNDIRSKGLVDALEDLKKHLVDSGDTATQQMRVLSNAFGGRQAMGVNILIAQIDRLKDKVKDVSQGGSDFGADWQKRTENLSYQLDKLKDSVDADADRLGFFLIPKLEEAGAVTGKVIQWFEKNKVAADALGAVIAGPLAAAVTVYATTKAMSFITRTGEMAMGMYKFGAKVAEVVPWVLTKMGLIGSTSEATAEKVATSNATIEGDNVALVNSYGTTAGEVKVAGTEIVASADGTAGGVDLALGSTGVGLVIVGLGLAAVELEQHWKEVMSAMESAAKTMASGVESALNSVIGLFNKTVGQITGDIGMVHSSLTNETLPTHNKGEFQGRGVMGEGKTGGSGSVEGQILKFWESKGFSPAAAAGFVGNAALESKLTPSEGGGGLCQQSGLGTAEANQVAQESVTGQSEVVLSRLSSSLIAQLKHIKNPAEAAKLIESQFEAPKGSQPTEEGYGTAEQGTAHLRQREEAAIKAAGGSNAGLSGLMNETSNAKAVKEQESEAKRAKEKAESKQEAAVKKAESKREEAQKKLEEEARETPRNERKRHRIPPQEIRSGDSVRDAGCDREVARDIHHR